MCMQVVKAIAGEDGVAVCRSLLDGIDDDGEGELQSRVTEGRCTGEDNVVRYGQLDLLILDLS